MRGAVSLAVARPDLTAQWHPTANGTLIPAEIAVHSNRSVWWRCRFGHEWPAIVNNRTGKGRGCPYCAGHRATAERNLAVLHPTLAGEWHPTKNGTLTPSEVLPRVNARVWWRCPSGHEWEAEVRNRSISGQGCPYCAGKRPTPGRNLATVFPEVAAQWHPTKNGSLRPLDVLPKATAKVWWRCPTGHAWAARVSSRTMCATGCPACAQMGPKGIPLGELAPELLDEWCEDLNGGPGDDVAGKSMIRVWWRCRSNPAHLWRTRVACRTKNGTGCPYCAGKRPTPERNLAAVFPDVAAEWHPTRNAELSPTDVLPRSSSRSWWRCAAGHEWEARVQSRTRDAAGCPHCARARRATARTSMRLSQADVRLGPGGRVGRRRERRTDTE
jgi:glutaredoxin